MATIAQYQGTGKRKTSVARVILRPGDGKTWFNGKTIEEYFPRAVLRQVALAPLKVAGVEGRYDLRVRVHGGGTTGQAGAVRHGIARALVDSDPELTRRFGLKVPVLLLDGSVICHYTLNSQELLRLMGRPPALLPR